ncbi:MAG: helix-turn-helix transcriptional regulator [Butyrivibrio sp.]|nr:helix-turn-helix transcriptional regulator [Butyrivibrio sp.]
METNLKLLAWKFENYYKQKKIPLWVFDQNHELSYTNFTTSAVLNLMEDMRKKAKTFRISHSIEGSYLDLDNPYEMYYEFTSDSGKHQFFTVIIGPVMTTKPTGNLWKNLSFGENLFVEQKRIISNVLPVVTKEEFLLEVTYFFKDILGLTPPDFKDKAGHVTHSEETHLQKEAVSSYDNEYLADNSVLYEEYCQLEDLYSIFVTNGSIYKLYSIFENESSLEILFPNKASYKDCIMRAVELLTVAKRSSIESGNDKKLCQARFAKYTGSLKTQKSFDKILNIVIEGTMGFARSTHDIKSHTNESYSPLTNKCIKRIIEKMPEKVSLEDLAGELHISAKYLSALFNKETGKSITDFMTGIRIDEAKRLLAGTDLSYLEISTLLNFCSQSYFNNQFKKFEGVTPKEYREKLSAKEQTI